jgi:tetratricopeptide (TPR) repeat protein
MMTFSKIVAALSLCLLFAFTTSTVCFAQEGGEADLEAAFALKPQAKTIGDFEEVAKLCRSALEKGLDSEGETEAKMLASSALFDHAQQLMIRIRQAKRDPTFFRNEALKRLREATELNDQMLDAWMMITTLNLLPNGDLDEARTAVDRAISISDDEPKKQSQAYLMRSLLVGQTDNDAGREDLDKAIDLDNENLRALRTRSNFLLMEGKIEDGLKDVDQLIEVAGANENIYASQADLLKAILDRKTAQLRVVKSRDGDETDSELPSEEELEAQIKQIQEAGLRYITKAIVLAPEKPEFYLAQARILQDLEDVDGALGAIETMLEKNESSIEGLLMKAQLLLADKANDEETEKVLDKALNLDPYSVATLGLRRAFFTARGQFDKGLKAAKKIAEKNPNSVAALQDLAISHSLADQPDEAVDIYSTLLSSPSFGLDSVDNMPPRQGVAIAATRMSFLRSRGDAFLSLGEHENAIEDYEEGLELGDVIEEIQSSIPGDFNFKGDDGILNNLAWVLSTSTEDKLRDGKRAIELATQACEITDYKMPHIISTLASAYAEAGDFDKAIEWIEKGLEVNEKAREEKDADIEAIDDQKKSLEDELKSYKSKKPWRENQAEEDAAKKEKEGDSDDKADSDEGSDSDGSSDKDDDK